MLRMHLGVRGLRGCALGDGLLAGDLALMALSLWSCLTRSVIISLPVFLAVRWFAASDSWALVLLHNYTPVGSNAFYLHIWDFLSKNDDLALNGLGATEVLR